MAELSSEVAAPFCIQLWMRVPGAPLLHQYLVLSVFQILTSSYSNKWIVLSHCSYNFKFSNDEWCCTFYHMLSCYNILKGMYSDPEIKLSTVVFSEKDRSSNFLVKVIFKHMNICHSYCEWGLFWRYYLTGYLFYIENSSTWVVILKPLTNFQSFLYSWETYVYKHIIGK